MRAAVLALLVAGCATTVPDRTGGLTLELDVRDAGNFAALYRLDTGGTLWWAGGDGARTGEFSWHGAMSDAEIAGLRMILEEDGWFGSDPPPDPPPAADAAAAPGRTTKVRLDGPQGRRRFTLEGRSRAVDRVTAYLEPITRRRYDEFLETLPKPKEPPPPPAPSPAGL